MAGIGQNNPPFGGDFIPKGPKSSLGDFPLLDRRAVIVENTFAEPLSLMVTF